MNSATLLSSPVSPLASMLRLSPLPDLRHLQVEEIGDEVFLEGIVTSYYLKQLAQETVRPALAERRLRNRIIVSKLK